MRTETGGPTRSGLCECGCGQETSLARNTIPARGQVKGEPVRFIRGHGSRRQSATFDRKYERGESEACWEWTGRVGNDGKGRFGHDCELAHRVAYRRARGDLSAHDEVTQICGNFLCVNPGHLALRDRSAPPPPNPSGLCLCGCGRPAPLAEQTDRRLGYVRGEPIRFIRGHVGNLRRRVALGSDDWAEEERGYETPCWIWTHGLLPAGYGRTKAEGRTQLAHRVMYRQEVGEIPDGHQVDHLCGQPSCVRPDHLEAVTRSEHARRGHSRHRVTVGPASP